MDYQAQLEQLRVELNAEMQRGSLRDEAKVNDLLQKQAEIEAQMEQEKQQAEQAQYQQSVEESQQQIAYILDELDIDGLKMRDLAESEGAYEVLRIAVQNIMLERDEQRLKEIQQLRSTYEGQITDLRNEKEKVQKQHDDLFDVNTSLRQELAQAKAQIDDLESKRDAAASELESYKAEVARLNSQVDDLRNEIAVGASAAVKVIDSNISASLADVVRKYKESLPIIYDVEPIDTKRSQYRAKLAENDQEITFSYLEKGKYREVSAEEATTFRQQAEESQHSDADNAQSGDSVPQSELTPPSVPFQDAVNGVDEGDVHGEVAAKTVEERLKALEDRVTALEYGSVKQGEAA